MFRRGRGKHARMEAEREEHVYDGLDDFADVDLTDQTPEFVAEDAPSGQIMGPFDSANSPTDSLTRVDIGALRVPVVKGVNIHPQIENDHVSAIVLVNGSSALQVIPFAAPREGGAWDDIRHDLRVKLAVEGYSPRDCEGEFGIELLANLPSQNGRQLVRFLGVDGPRWFIRAMFTGAAASDPAAGKPLIDVLANIVVFRGNEPRPVRDPLPMHLPAEQAPAAQATGGQPPARVASAAASRDNVTGRRSGERAPEQSSYLAGATYRERYGPVADETIEIRGLPFVDDDDLALTR